MHLLCLLKNGLGKQMLLELSLNVNDFLGYSTISSTEIYATPDSKKQREEILKNSQSINVKNKYSPSKKESLDSWLKRNMK